jgi:PAS domain S-box-containing protein
MATWLGLLASGEPGQEEARLRRFDGEYRWFLFRAEPVRDEQGEVVRWYGTNTDIEDRKRAEDKLQVAMSEWTCLLTVRAEIGMAFAHKGGLREILHACAEVIVRQLDAAFARIWTLSSDGRELELQASAGMYTHLNGRHSRIPVGELKIGWIAQEGKAHLTNAVQSDPRISDKDWAKTENMTSFAGYPLIVQDRVVGVLGMFSRNLLTQDTLDTLALVADAVAQGIERKRAEEKLRQDERELRRITDAIPQAISVLVPDGTVLHANQVVLDYTGLTWEDLKTDDFRIQLFHPDDLERVRDKRQKALEHGAPFELELRARRKDGQYRWFLFRYNPLRDDEGRIIRWYETGIDIEDRKQAEERIRNENMALREEIDRTSMFEEIVGSSEALRKVLQQVAKVAPVDSTVYLRRKRHRFFPLLALHTRVDAPRERKGRIKR